ncbi:MAG: hypothetical protein K2K19_04810, partial [Acetatifactor sp.]|nr:hypothetical protein [Acetatifactor sp.]
MLCICILLTASGCSTGGQETAQNDTPILLADITMQCEVWESRNGEEDTLPVEIFKDLQRYVAGGECAEALSAYRQEELICTVEELKEFCPDYEMLVAEYFKTEHGETLLDTNKIYRLEAANDKSCFLLFYRRLDTDREGYSFLGTMLLQEDTEGWRITSNSSSLAGGVDDYEVFAREEAGQKVYYFLKAYGLDDSFAWLELSRLSEEFYVPVGGWKIMLIKTGVEAEILFQETKSDLTVQVKEYVGDNKCFLAWMQQNGMPIWGDEDEQTHYEMREPSDSGEADTGIEQIWIIDFDG